MKKLFFGLFIIATSLLMAQSQAVKVERYVDWEERHIVFFLTTAVDQGSLPASKQQSEAVIDRLNKTVIASNLNDFPLDSWGNFKLENRRMASFDLNLESAASKAVKDYSVFTQNMMAIRVVFNMPFSALTSSINVKSRSVLQPTLMPMPEVFAYSGIVIFAALELPSYGNSSSKGFLQPALLPSVMSDSGQLLLSYNTVKREMLANWGTASYSFSDNPLSWPSDRVGKNPLVISARSLYGEGLVDAVISKNDADHILGSARGRELLEEGRVLLIIKKPRENDKLIEKLNKELDAAVGDTLSRQYNY